MAHFLSTADAYRLLERELPAEVYADGEPGSSFSTADHAAVAETIGSLYACLAETRRRYFPQTAGDGLRDWEIRYFGQPLPGDLTPDQRLAQVLAKIRSRPGISLWDVMTQVIGGFPEGVFLQFYEIRAGGEGWVLGRSKLGVGTRLFAVNPLTLTGSQADQLLTGPGTPTDDQLTAMRIQSYRYRVRIFDYVLTAAQRQALDVLLTRVEPANSDHSISDGLRPQDYNLGTPVPAVDRFTAAALGCTCFCRDSASPTGYVGLRSPFISAEEDALLQQSGDFLLGEDGSKILLETPTPPGSLLQQSGDKLLQESGDDINLEDGG